MAFVSYSTFRRQHSSWNVSQTTANFGTEYSLKLRIVLLERTESFILHKSRTHVFFSHFCIFTLWRHLSFTETVPSCLRDCVPARSTFCKCKPIKPSLLIMTITTARWPTIFHLALHDLLWLCSSKNRWPTILLIKLLHRRTRPISESTGPDAPGSEQWAIHSIICLPNLEYTLNIRRHHYHSLWEATIYLHFIL